jgi:hypothetical protein
MNMKQRFRSFVGNFPRIVLERKYMPRYSGHYSQPTEFPISVNNFLNMVPEIYRHKVFMWICNRGMLEASRNRRLLCNHYNKKYGTHFSQEDMFSPMAYSKNPTLEKIKNQIEHDWFDHDLEPRYIQIRGDAQSGVRVIDARQINAHLEEMGEEPMYFGGTNGLLQYIQQGKWAPEEMHIDSPNDEQGHDVAIPDGSSGVYDLAQTIKELRDKLAAATTDVERNKLEDQIKQAETDMEEDGGVSQITKLGRGKVGFIPPVKDTQYKGELADSALKTRGLILRTIKDLQQGKSFEQLDQAEIRLIKKLYNSGKIDVRTEKMTLRGLFGIVRRQTTGEMPNISPENIVMLKASVKAYLIQKMKESPDVSRGTDTKSAMNKTAMGPEPTGLLDPAIVRLAPEGPSIVLSKLTDPNDEDMINHYADMITDAMIDDKTGVMKYTSIEVQRTLKGVFVKKGPHAGKPVRAFDQAVQNEELVSPNINKSSNAKALQNMAANGTTFEVNFRGKKHEVYPQEVLKHLAERDVELAAIKDQKIVDPSVTSKDTEFDARNLEGYDLIGQKGNILTFQDVTGRRQKINTKMTQDNVTEFVNSNGKAFKKFQGYAIVKFPEGAFLAAEAEDGEWYRLETTKLNPIDDQPITNDVYDPRNQVEEFGNGKYVRVRYPDGRTNIAKRSVDQETGEDVWYKINDVKTGINKNPIFSPLSMRINAGIGGAKPQMAYDMKKNHELWNYFLNHPAEFGETEDGEDAKPQAVPKSIRMGVGRNSDELGEAQYQLMMNVGNIAFKFGDFDKKGKNGRKSDVYDLIAKCLSPEDMEADHFPEDSQLIKHIKHALYGNPGERTTPRTLVPFDGPELFMPPNKVRSDIYQALIKNGFEWRRRKAGGVAASINRDEKAKEIAFGQGGEQTDADRYNDIEDASTPDFYDSRYDDPDIDNQAYGDDEIEDGEGRTSFSIDQPMISTDRKKRDITHGYDAKERPEDEPDTRLIVGRQRRSVPRSTNVFSKPATPPMMGASQKPEQKSPNPYDPDTYLSQKSPDPYDPDTYLSQKSPNPYDPDTYLNRKMETTNLLGYRQWLSETGTGAVYDPKVPVRNGGGFNWWGAAGNPLGVCISGEADTAKTDPTGKGKRGKSTASRK